MKKKKQVIRIEVEDWKYLNTQKEPGVSHSDIIKRIIKQIREGPKKSGKEYEHSPSEDE